MCSRPERLRPLPNGEGRNLDNGICCSVHFIFEFVRRPATLQNDGTSESTIDLLTRERMTDPVRTTGKSLPTISRKPVGVGVASQQLMPTEEQTWIADAHRDDGKRFVVHADEKLTAFLELGIGVLAEPGWSAYKAKPYIRIRLCLTRQVCTVTLTRVPHIKWLRIRRRTFPSWMLSPLSDRGGPK